MKTKRHGWTWSFAFAVSCSKRATCWSIRHGAIFWFWTNLRRLLHLLDQHVARLLLEAAKYTQSTWKNGFLVILCRGGGRHNALGSYDMTLPRSSGHWLFEDVESSLLRSFKLTRYLATLQNSVAATLITGSRDAWQPGWTAVHVPRALEETWAIATGCLQLNITCSRIGVRCLATHAGDASHWACHRSITFLFFFRRPSKKSKDYNVSILLPREKLREGIPFWLKAFEFASPRISNVWILLELRGCWPWSCANSSICCVS